MIWKAVQGDEEALNGNGKALKSTGESYDWGAFKDGEKALKGTEEALKGNGEV